MPKSKKKRTKERLINNINSPCRSKLALIQEEIKHIKKPSLLVAEGKLTVSEMSDSTNLYKKNEFTKLKQNLLKDGYLLIRNFFESSLVNRVREKVLTDMRDNGFIHSDTIHKSSENDYETNSENNSINGTLSPTYDSRMTISPWPDDIKGPSLLDRSDLHFLCNPIFEHPDLYSLMDHLIDPIDPNAEIATLPYKWLRAVGTSKYTGPHMDRVYLNQNNNLITAWIPLGDIPMQMGALVVANESHRLDSFARLRNEYGHSKLGSDGTSSGWISEDPNQIEALYDTGSIDWRSTNFKAGDICLFGIDLLHSSANNITDCWRLSCDTRWYRIGHPYPPYAS